MLLPQVVPVAVPRKLSLADPSPCSFAGGSTSTSASSTSAVIYPTKDRFCLGQTPVQPPRYRVSLTAALGLASNMPVLTQVEEKPLAVGDSSSTKSAETDAATTSTAPDTCALLASLCARLSPEAFAAAMTRAEGLAYEE